jgi:homoserine kinase
MLACAQRDGVDAHTDARLVSASVQNNAPEVLFHAIALEGHADNAAPAVLGGVVASTGDQSVRIPIGFDPAVVVWVPSFTTRTDHSRSMLEKSVSMADAAFNIGHVAVLVAALVLGDVTTLRHATQDRLHQEQRFGASPSSKTAFTAALEAGAWCAWLSGSGPTIAALCAHEHADALATALTSAPGADGHVKVLHVDLVGATLST